MHTPEQIEKWACEVGMNCRPLEREGEPFWAAWPEQLTRFAALVAQHERERIRAALLAEAGKWVGDFRVPVHRAISDGATAAGLNITRDDCYAAIRNSDGG